MIVKMHLNSRNNRIFLITVKFTMSIRLNAENTENTHKFLNQIEIDKVEKLYNAMQSNEQLFWKLLKNQKPSSQMSAFLVDGTIKTILVKTIFEECGPSILNQAHLQPTQI